MNSFTYDDVNYRVFGIINDGTVLNSLNTKEEHRSNLFSFLHNSLGIMNYTSKTGKTKYIIKETENGYTININWISTKLKSETTLNFLKILEENQEIPEVKTDWRNAIKLDLTSLYENCEKVVFDFVKTENKEYTSNLFCEISFENLLSSPVHKDEPDEDFEYKKIRFSVPYELIQDVINENINEAFKYFGNDHDKLFEHLKPYEGKEYFADFLIGATYYIYLELPNKAYAYFKRALLLLKNQDFEIPAMLLDLIASIEMSEKNNPKQAEEYLIKSLLVGNEQGFLKLAYLYLKEAENDKKQTALSLAEIGEQILPFDEDKEHQISGYHILASVYLWNKEFKKAEIAHQHFLTNKEWCEKYPDLVRAYLILAIAYDNQVFMTNIITDYVFLTKLYPSFFDVWHYKVINPFEQKFKGKFIETLQLLELTKKLYE